MAEFFSKSLNHEHNHSSYMVSCKTIQTKITIEKKIVEQSLVRDIFFFPVPFIEIILNSTSWMRTPLIHLATARWFWLVEPMACHLVAVRWLSSDKPKACCLVAAKWFKLGECFRLAHGSHQIILHGEIRGKSPGSR
jgi:hypothetical protein